MSARKKVESLIGKQKKKSKGRIFLDKETFLKFYKEVEPLYIKQYGAIICDQSSMMDGYDNILFQGFAVCLEDEAPQEIPK